MLPSIDLSSWRFEAPDNLWLLLAPAVLLLLWMWQLGRRLADVRRLALHHRSPVRSRVPRLGDLVFWLTVILATTSTIVALARPSLRASLVRDAGVDLVILQDASASMRVKDVSGDRWQRSMRFLRTLGNALSWRDDRVALALFARIAAPQVRLTRDPTTFFFFLDHLDREPPFRLDDDTTWDTNMEIGIDWGLQLVDRDEDVRGPSPNVLAFVLISDGQAFSGEASRALEEVRTRGIPLTVIGVGTTAGDFIPEPAADPDRPVVASEPIRSSLDRQSLRGMAAAAGGSYHELDRRDDLVLASEIIGETRRRAGRRNVDEAVEEFYWWCLMVAAGLLAPGILCLRERTDAWLQLAAVALASAVIVNLR